MLNLIVPSPVFPINSLITVIFCPLCRHKNMFLCLCPLTAVICVTELFVCSFFFFFLKSSFIENSTFYHRCIRMNYSIIKRHIFLHCNQSYCLWLLKKIYFKYSWILHFLSLHLFLCKKNL